MSEKRFSFWLQQELMSLQQALLVLYETYDEMLYVTGPQLEQQYLDLLGPLETEVIREEIECEVLDHKKMLVQIALNRRQPVDLAAIEAETQALRQEKLAEAEAGAPQPQRPLPDPETQKQLQKLYRSIVEDFHPQTHPALTQTQRQLFEQGLEAYKRGDLEALQLVCEMLRGPQIEFKLELFADESSEKVAEDLLKAVRESTEDYALAGLCYSCFAPMAEELALQQRIEEFRTQFTRLEAELKALQCEFPWSARQTLADPAQTEAYRQTLQQRLQDARRQQEKLRIAVQQMLEKAVTV